MAYPDWPDRLLGHLTHAGGEHALSSSGRIGVGAELRRNIVALVRSHLVLFKTVGPPYDIDFLLLD